MRYQPAIPNRNSSDEVRSERWKVLSVPEFLDQAQEQRLASMAALPRCTDAIGRYKVQITGQFQEFGSFNRRAVRDVQVVRKLREDFNA